MFHEDDCCDESISLGSDAYKEMIVVGPLKMGKHP